MENTKVPFLKIWKKIAKFDRSIIQRTKHITYVARVHLFAAFGVAVRHHTQRQLLKYVYTGERRNERIAYG